MRLCDVMGSQLRAFRGGAGTSVQVDEVYLDESLRAANPEASCPAGRTATAASPGARPLQTQDRRRHRRERPGGLLLLGGLQGGKAGIEGVRASLSGVDLAGSRVATDRLRSYIRPLRAAGVAAHNRYNAKEAGEDELGMVNALHSRLRGFL